MGSHFQPLLPRVMELILNGANQTTNFSMVDADDDEVEGEVVIKYVRYLILVTLITDGML